MPPKVRIATQVRNNQPRNQICQRDGNNAGDPHKAGQRHFKIHLRRIGILGESELFIEEVGAGRGNDHHHAHDKQPYQQLNLNHFERLASGLLIDSQQNECDQSHTRHAVGFKTISTRPNGIARVVACAVGHHARIARIVFLDVKNNFHQV